MKKIKLFLKGLMSFFNQKERKKLIKKEVKEIEEFYLNISPETCTLLNKIYYQSLFEKELDDLTLEKIPLFRIRNFLRFSYCLKCKKITPHFFILLDLKSILKKRFIWKKMKFCFKEYITQVQYAKLCLSHFKESNLNKEFLKEITQVSLKEWNKMANKEIILSDFSLPPTMKQEFKLLNNLNKLENLANN